MKRYFIFLILLSLLFTVKIYPIMVLNNIKEVFQDSRKDEIESCMVEGSEHFLLSNANIHLFFAEYEKSSSDIFNFEKGKKILEVAINELSSALKIYEDVLTVAKLSIYDSNDQIKLKDYNYSELIEKNLMYSSIADEVKKYLSDGDVVGLYVKNIENLKLINTTLLEINNSVTIGVKPNKNLMYRLLRLLYRATLWGNYATILGDSALRGN